MENMKVSGFSWILLAFCAFAGRMSDPLYSDFVLPAFFGGSSFDDGNTVQVVIHLIITCITWSIVAVILIRTADRKFQLNLFGKSEKLKIRQWITVGIIVVLTASFFYMAVGNFRIVEEFKYHRQHHGWSTLIFQYIYYVLEIVIVALIIVFAQKAGEIWFKKEKIPYGGILLGLTWGVAHIFTKDMAVGIVALFLGILFGTVYLLVNRDIKKTIIISLIMFII
jgi:hypothetical protein